MRKIILGSTLGLAVVGSQAQALEVFAPSEPAGVTAAGKVNLAEAPGEQGILIGLNKAGDQTAHKVGNDVKIQPSGDGSVLKVQPNPQIKIDHNQGSGIWKR